MTNLLIPALPRAILNTRYGSVLVFEPIAPQFEKRAEAQVLPPSPAPAVLAHRPGPSRCRPRGISPIIDGLTIACRCC